MGLFSFLKNAGSKLFSKKEEERGKTTTSGVNDEVADEQKRILLKGIVNSMNISVEDLSIDVDGDAVTIYGQAESWTDKEKVVLAVGNVAGVASVDDRMSVVAKEEEEVVEEVAPQFYEVKRGDTLSKIAKAHYGDWRKYTDIFEANKPMLKDPDRIYPGQKLRLPQA